MINQLWAFLHSAPTIGFLLGYAAGFATFALLLILWKWIKWELSGNWL